jgi:hypothetical protein
MNEPRFLSLRMKIYVNHSLKLRLKKDYFRWKPTRLQALTRYLLNSIRLCEIVKYDIFQLFSDFHAEKVNISRINYGIITLLPKKSDASTIQQYRPIYLLNCIYKLITKTLTKTCKVVVLKRNTN